MILTFSGPLATPCCDDPFCEGCDGPGPTETGVPIGPLYPLSEDEQADRWEDLHRGRWEYEDAALEQLLRYGDPTPC